MKLVEILRNTDIVKKNVDLNTDIKDIKYNSKDVEKGDVFVAIKGNSVNGHSYIGAAVDNGAVCVVCESAPDDITVPYVLVRNSRIALAQMSKLYFGSPDEKLSMVGVTGTNGKTSTTYFLKDILNHRFGDKVGLIGTNQNLVGSKPYEAEGTTPQSYDIFKLLREMVDIGCKYCVMEVSSHALEQHRVYGIRFKVGVFTNLSHDHLDFHISFENYKNAKAKLFKQSDYAVINADDGNFSELIGGASTRNFSYSAQSDTADLYAKNIDAKGRYVEFEAVGRDFSHTVRVPVPGMFTVYNSLAAIGAALILGVEIDDIALALKNAKAVVGRFERVESPVPFDVIIDYAHTPQGMESVLSMTRQITKGRVITVFGCGGDRDKTKRPSMGAIAVKYSDITIVTSDNTRSESPIRIVYDTLAGVLDSDKEVDVILDRKEAILYAMKRARQHDTVLLLGKGHELYMIQNGQKNHFDEREIVKSFK